MSSQYGEHSYILDYFGGRVGRFLDIGAFDGVTFSNTRPLADLGWSGVCVEPSPPAFCALMRAYEGNDKVQLVNAGVRAAGGIGLTRFYSNTVDAHASDMLSSFSEQHVQKCAAYPFREIWIPAIGWDSMIDMVDEVDRYTHDFINIDVEGTNLEVLASMPFHLFLPQMICIEMDPADKVPAMSKILSDQGLSEQRMIGGNLLAARPK